MASDRPPLASSSSSTSPPAAPPQPSRAFLQPRRHSSSAGGLLSDSTSDGEGDGNRDGDALLSPVEEGNGQAFYFGEKGMKLEPYSAKHDPSVRWVYEPATLVTAAVGAAGVAALAYNSEHIFPRQLREHLCVPPSLRSSGAGKLMIVRHRGVISGVVVFLIFCMLNFRDT